MYHIIFKAGINYDDSDRVINAQGLSSLSNVICTFIFYVYHDILQFANVSWVIKFHCSVKQQKLNT